MSYAEAEKGVDTDHHHAQPIHKLIERLQELFMELASWANLNNVRRGNCVLNVTLIVNEG